MREKDSLHGSIPIKVPPPEPITLVTIHVHPMPTKQMNKCPTPPVLEKKAADPVINYGGRFVYLETIDKQWPELLDALCAQCLPAFLMTVPPANRSELANFTALCSYPGAEACVGQLRAWAAESNLRDEWILDAAVQTLRYMAAPRPTRWVYIAPDLPVPTFEAKFESAWIPAMMDWPNFKKDLTEQLWARLEPYRKEVSPIWGNDRRSLGMQAMWTVWWQRKHSPAQIRIKNSSLGLPEVSRVNIQNGIRSFARSIGLTLQRPGAR